MIDGPFDGDHAAFWAWSGKLCERSADRRARAEAQLTVYFGAEFRFSDARDSLQEIVSALTGESTLEPIGYNLVASCADTMAGHLLRNKVRPLFVTDRGSVDQKQQAEGMQRAVEGEFHAAGVYGDLGVDVCYRGLILDAGGVKTQADVENGRVDYQIVWPHEFFVPRQEEIRSGVRRMVHQYDVDREVLIRMFPEKKRVLENIAARPFAGQREICDRLEVREGWEIRPETGGEGGRRVLSVDGETLVAEDYGEPDFPVAWFRPMRAQGSYWSRGYPERLAGAQSKLNEYQDRIDAILNLHARPLLVTWARAGLNRAKITNSIASILVSKVPPSQALWQMTPQAVPRELVERVQAIIAWGEKQAGLSELSINAQKPAGIEHAPALRHLADTEAVRHTMVFRAWEQFHLDLARLTVGALRTLATERSDYETLFGSQDELVRVRWKDVDLGRDRYHLTCWPTNLLPQTPSAKIATLIEMVQNQMISPKEAMSRFENPDVRDLLGDASAAQQNIERILRDALDGKPGASVPHAYMDLGLLQMKAKERINRLQADGETPEKIDRLVQLFQAALELERKTTALGNLAAGKGGVVGIQTAAGVAPTQVAAGAAPAQGNPNAS